MSFDQDQVTKPRSGLLPAVAIGAYLNSGPLDGHSPYIHDPTLRLNFCPEKYQGKWWLFAEYPTKKTDPWREFQGKFCFKSKAEYRWNSCRKELEIVNTCYSQYPEIRKVKTRYGVIYDEIEGTGETGSIKGTATIVNPKVPRKLYVDFGFDPSLLKSLDSGNQDLSSINQYIREKEEEKRANYLILDTDYCNYSIVCNGDKSHLWILTRSYCISLKKAKFLMKRLATLGGNPEILETSKNSICPCSCSDSSYNSNFSSEFKSISTYPWRGYQ